MALLTLDRLQSNASRTLGALCLDGRFLCWTCEDAYHEVKVPGQTRIPAGSYEVALRQYGAKHATYLAAYPAMHRGMLWLQNVPGFEYILIHCGNTELDSEGCLLVGAEMNASGVLRSREAYVKIYPQLAELASHRQLQISIWDRDR